MCKYCERLKERGVAVLGMKNGRPDEHGLTSIEMGTVDGERYLLIREKPYLKDEYIWTKSIEPISYCPYCGEDLH